MASRKVGSPRVPIYVDIRGSKGYPAAVAGQLKAGMPAIEHSVFGWSARLTDQPYLVLVDNYDPNDGEHNRWLTEAYRALPKARFIVCAKAPFAMHGTKSRPKINLPFGHRTWVLYPFDRSEVRALVKKYGLPENLSSDVIVEEIRFKFRAIGIPLTGPFICMYLTVLKEKKKYAPINAAAVIENFVEQALGKGGSAIIYQDDFDYAEQISILSYCSEVFVRKNIESMEFSEIYGVVNEYYKELGMRRDAQKIVNHFIDKTIFENYGNKIYFRYKVVYSYLIAKRMEEDKKFKEFVLSIERVYEFVSEIDMYTGINRGDVDTLAIIEKYHDDWTAEMRQEFGPYVDVASVTDIKLPKTKDMDEFVEAMQARVDENHSAEDRDAEVGQEHEDPSQFVQKFKRREGQDILIRWIKLTACYSVVVKNSDRLSAEQKKYHLRKVLTAWGMLVGLAFKIVALLLENGKVKVGSFEFNFGVGKLKEPRVVRMIIANVPQIISQYTRMYAASGKLEDIFKGMGELEDFPEFLRVAAISDLRMDEFLGEIGKYHKRFRSNTTMLESLMWKLRDSFLRFGLAKQFVQPMRQQIAEFSADILGLKGERRTRSVADTMQRLADQKLTSSLKQRKDQ